MFVSPDRFDPEFDLLEDLAKVSGRPLSISLLQRVGATEQWRRILTRIERPTPPARRSAPRSRPAASA
jgi:hypothetical protein